MLGKLIKHEFKSTAWSFLVMYAALIFVTVMQKIFVVINSENEIINILEGLFMAFYVICIIGVVFGTTILIIYRFYQNMVKDQAYLSFTLPVTTAQHITSKLIVSLVWVIASYIVAGISLLIMLIGNGMEQLPDFIAECCKMATEYGLWIYVIELVIIMILGLLSNIVQFFAFISIGQMFNKHKILGAIVAYFANSMIIQVIATIMMFVIGSMDWATMDYSTSMGPLDAFKTYGGIYFHMMLGLVIVMNVVYFAIAHWALDKKLNLE